MFFDGGARRREGTGGYIVWGTKGQLLTATARWYGEERPTNNAAEVYALVNGVEWIIQTSAISLTTPLIICGDSRLIIDFCNRVARPGQQTLFLAIRRMQALAAIFRPRPKYVHVLRDGNMLADWLTRVAREARADVDLTEQCRGMPMGSFPPCQPSTALSLFKTGTPPSLHHDVDWQQLQHWLGDKGLTILESKLTVETTAKMIETKVPFGDIRCPECAFPHIEADEFVTRRHHKHLCHRCGTLFSGTIFHDHGPVAGSPISTLGPKLQEGKLWFHPDSYEVLPQEIGLVTTRAQAHQRRQARLRGQEAEEERLASREEDGQPSSSQSTGPQPQQPSQGQQQGQPVSPQDLPIEADPGPTLGKRPRAEEPPASGVGTPPLPVARGGRRKLPPKKFGRVPCATCNLMDRRPVGQCWFCGNFFHAMCLGFEISTFYPGPVLCKACRDDNALPKPTEPAGDFLLMHLVATGSFHVDTPDQAKVRLVQVAAHYRWENGRLYHKADPRDDQRERQIPPKHQRQKIVEQVQASLGYPGGRRLFDLLKATYYWPGMLDDCIKLCSDAVPCQMEHAKFPSPAYLIPTRKDFYPFHTWCVDLITGFSPGPRGEKVLVVAVCAFSKWVEVGALHSKHAWGVAAWFHREITCRFGTPVAVWTDQGTEFAGYFHSYLSTMRTQHRYISVAHPRANGLVERYNGVIRSGLRKLQFACPAASWVELLPEVLAGMRLLPTRMGLSPFVLIYKQRPNWLGTEVLVDGDLPEECCDDEYWGWLLTKWEALLDNARDRIIKGDLAMVRAYGRQIPNTAPDLRFALEPGQWVIMKQKIPGKEQMRATGPYKFLSYTGPKHVAAMLQEENGTVIYASIANLVPFRGSPTVREVPASRTVPPPVPEPFMFDSEPESSSDGLSDDDENQQSGPPLPGEVYTEE